MQLFVGRMHHQFVPMNSQGMPARTELSCGDSLSVGGYLGGYHAVVVTHCSQVAETLGGEIPDLVEDMAAWIGKARAPWGQCTTRGGRHSRRLGSRPNGRDRPWRASSKQATNRPYKQSNGTTIFVQCVLC